MASSFSHAVAALGIGACFHRPGISKRVWVAREPSVRLYPTSMSLGFAWAFITAISGTPGIYPLPSLRRALGCFGLDPGFSVPARYRPPLDLGLPLSGHGEPWFAGRYDRRRPRRCVLFAV